ncbi:vacuolar amino acid transporter 1 [Physcia stellaris]|nr:vacuolar amino acid transporter 1 [Physcia stellaris]
MTRLSSSRIPQTWADYERGQSPRQGSISSETSRVHFDEPSQSAISPHLDIPRSDHAASEQALRHRRSSLSTRVSSLAQLGGVNSLENFARSWQRAAGFNELPSGRPSGGEQDQDGLIQHRSIERGSISQHRSLLRQQLERQGTSSAVAVDSEAPSSRHEDEEALHLHRSSDYNQDAVLSSSPYLSSPFLSTNGGLYGSLSSRIAPVISSLPRQPTKAQQEGDVLQQGKEHEPLLTKVIEREDAKIDHIIIGQSTLPQTVFNSVNILIGVGILSLPLGFRYSGWLFGLIFLFLAALTTRYTSGLLARCIALDDSLVTFADIAHISFGLKGRVATSILFTIELMAACVALVVLFGDSLYGLIPIWGVVEWKILCGAILIPLSFVPLRYLSFTSVLGIMSCLGIVTLVVVDGLLKPRSPGSLRDPVATHAFPSQWSTLPLSFGLLMSPWGGHSVFPNIYRDMRHPQKYTRAINYTFVFTYFLDLCMAVVGLLMFGDQLRDEVTSNIVRTSGYPHAISVCIVIFIAIIPLTKVPLK